MNIELKIKDRLKCIERFKRSIEGLKESIEMYEREIVDLENEKEFPYFLRNYVDSHDEMMKNRTIVIKDCVRDSGYQFTYENFIKDARCTGRSTRIILEMFRDILYKDVKNWVFISENTELSTCIVRHATKWLDDSDIEKLNLTDDKMSDGSWLYNPCKLYTRTHGDVFKIYIDHHICDKTKEWVNKFIPYGETSCSLKISD